MPNKRTKKRTSNPPASPKRLIQEKRRAEMRQRREAALRKRRGSQFSKEELKNKMNEARGMGSTAQGLYKDLGKAERATKAAITAATLPIGGSAARGASGLSKLVRGKKVNPFRSKSGPKRPTKPATKRPKPVKNNPFKVGVRTGNNNLSKLVRSIK